MRFLLSLSACLLLFSCKMKSNDETHIPGEKMQNILLDLSLAEVYSTMAKDSLHKVGAKDTDSLAHFYKSVFAHHHITLAQFQSSMAWYKKHPDELDSIFNNILPVVTRLQELPK